MLAVICRGLRVRQWMIEFRVAASPPVASTGSSRLCPREMNGKESHDDDVLMHVHVDQRGESVEAEAHSPTYDTSQPFSQVKMKNVVTNVRSGRVSGTVTLFIGSAVVNDIIDQLMDTCRRQTYKVRSLSEMQTTPPA